MVEVCGGLAVNTSLIKSARLLYNIIGYVIFISLSAFLFNQGTASASPPVCQGDAKLVGSLLYPFETVVQLPGFGSACLKAVANHDKRPAYGVQPVQGVQNFRFVILTKDKKILSVPLAPIELWDSEVDTVCSGGVFSNQKLNQTVLVIIGEISTRRGIYFATIMYRYKKKKFKIDREASIANGPVGDKCSAKYVANSFFKKESKEH